MILDDRCEPLHRIIDGLNGTLMRMLSPPPVIIEAIAAHYRVLQARKIRANMRGSFFPMDSACNSPGCKGGIIKHREVSIYI